MMKNSEASPSLDQRLKNIDWNFADITRSEELHSIHPYPAKFIPQIPRTLIRELELPKGTAILDPFCGSGTTLVEAQNTGIPAFGVDLNPIACLISRVKTTRLPQDFLGVAEVCLDNAKQKQSQDYKLDIPNVDHWFKSSIQTALIAITQEIEQVLNPIIKDALRLALSSIIVRVSNQDSDTRYAAVEKNVTDEDVFNLFRLACQKLEKVKGNDLFQTGNLPEVKVIERNILEITPEDLSHPIGMIITSPPYPNAYEYWLYHKYRMWWLGYDPLEVKRKEIGARAHYFKKNHQTSEDFILQMQKLFGLINEVIVSSGYICFVIGRSIIHGEYIDNAAILEEVGSQLNLRLVAKIERSISQNRKSFNLSHARIKTETLVIFQKK